MTTRATRSPRRRTVVALGVVLAILTAFVVRLVDIQVVNAQAHIDDSIAMGLGESVVLKGTRGSIVDSDGVVLAESTLLYDAEFSPVDVKPLKVFVDGVKTEIPWEESAAAIGAVTGQSADEVMQIVAAALEENPESQFAYLKRGISTEQYRALAELGLPYLHFESQAARTYPNGAVAGNLTGFLGSDGVPLAGLELQSGSCLDATDGEESFERGNDGVVIPGTLQESPATDGGTLELTIDADLQWYMQQLIAEQVRKQKAKFGTITVVEVATGKIRVAAEYPTVDPNDIDAKGSYLFSHIFTGTFEPGSTFKALTASALIDGAQQKPTSTADVAGVEKFSNGAKVRDSFSHPTYTYTLAGVLIDSSNAGISVFSERIKPAERYAYLEKFGIGSGSAVGFLGEEQGLLYPVEQWNNQQLYDTAYGQGLTTTVPELVGAYDAIANGGLRMPLSLVEACHQADGTVVEPDQPEPVRVMSEKSASQVTTILENVATQAPYADRIKIPGYRIAVKTGTGQKSKEGGGGYKAGVYYTTMIGFAPADDPQYIVAITLDEPRKVRSSAANAEGFKKAMTQVLKTYRVLPSSSKAPRLDKYK